MIIATTIIIIIIIVLISSFYFYYRFHVNILLLRLIAHGYSISCPPHHQERTDNKPLIG